MVCDFPVQWESVHCLFLPFYERKTTRCSFVPFLRSESSVVYFVRGIPAGMLPIMLFIPWALVL
jgi:hypothetical protein